MVKKISAIIRKESKILGGVIKERKKGCTALFILPAIGALASLAYLGWHYFKKKKGEK